MEHRFQFERKYSPQCNDRKTLNFVSDIEEVNEFECLALIDEDTPDSVIMEKGIDRCSNLPRIENGAWNCTHGTCNLRFDHYYRGVESFL